MDALKNVWPDWKIVEKIGSGAFGTVYSVQKEEDGRLYESAVKVIHIPQDEAEVRELKNSGMDYQSICGFYKNVKKDLLNEISVMETLRTASNIVSIDDYKEVPSEDGIGWTMYIRMEKLTSLSMYQEAHTMDINAIVKLGHDMCNALSCCEKKNIIHRDVKPDNIFVNEFGDFKLGDFGISRQLEKTQSVRSQKGTYQYMAPEVYRGESYNQTVDIYSLGIVLYRLLNDGRFPFVPDAPMPLFPDDIDKAFTVRMQGKDLPVPMSLRISASISSDKNGCRDDFSSHLFKVIQKACAYRTEDRYQDAEEFSISLSDSMGAHKIHTENEENKNSHEEWKNDDRTGSYFHEEETRMRGQDLHWGMIKVSEDEARNGVQKTIHTRDKTVVVNVPANVKNGAQIRLKDLGEQGTFGMPNGDLYINVRILKKTIDNNVPPQNHQSKSNDFADKTVKFSNNTADSIKTKKREKKNKDVIIEDPSSLRMRWHRFTIYFQLFANCVLCIGLGFSILFGHNGMYRNGIYDFHPGLQGFDVCSGIIYLCIGIFAIVTRQKLVHFKKDAPKSLIITLFFEFIVSLDLLFRCICFCRL
jgi:serine/threonine protein kinase